MAHGNTQTHTHTHTLTKKWKYTENQNLSEDPALLYIDQLISHTKAFPSSKLVPAAARNPKGINRAAALAAWALLGSLGFPHVRKLT